MEKKTAYFMVEAYKKTVPDFFPELSVAIMAQAFLLFSKSRMTCCTVLKETARAASSSGLILNLTVSMTPPLPMMQGSEQAPWLKPYFSTRDVLTGMISRLS